MRLQKPATRPPTRVARPHSWAAELVAAKVTRKPVETVEAILMAHGKGDPLKPDRCHGRGPPQCRQEGPGGR